MDGQDFGFKRGLMATNQLRPNAISDVAVLAAMGAVPRERFVAAHQGGIAYSDAIVPLAAGRSLNPALPTARLVQASRVDRGQHVLVVGAATGYVPAIYAALGARVTALDEVPELLAQARSALAGDPAVTIVEGPLAAGWPASAPYDVVHVEGGVEHIPEAILDQVSDGGVVVAALVDRGITHLVEGRHVAGGFGVMTLADADFARLPGFAPAPAFAF